MGLRARRCTPPVERRRCPRCSTGIVYEDSGRLGAEVQTLLGASLRFGGISTGGAAARATTVQQFGERDTRRRSHVNLDAA